MRKQPEIREKTRNELVTAFWKLYEHKNIEKITISELTTLAGYHRGTFYEYFKDIYDLLEQEEASFMNELKDNFKRIYASQDFQNFINYIPQFYMKNGKYISIMIKQGNVQFLDRFKAAVYPVFLELQGLEPNVENRLLVEYGISGILMCVHKWYEEGCQIPINDFFKLMYSLTFKGLFNTMLICKKGSVFDEEITAPEGFATLFSQIQKL